MELRITNYIQLQIRRDLSNIPNNVGGSSTAFRNIVRKTWLYK